jgi:hypothetical protein
VRRAERTVERATKLHQARIAEVEKKLHQARVAEVEKNPVQVAPTKLRAEALERST